MSVWRSSAPPAGARRAAYRAPPPPPRGYARVPTSTSPRTAPGYASAHASASAPPHECPTSSGRAAPNCLGAPRSSRACAAGVVAAAARPL